MRGLCVVKDGTGGLGFEWCVWAIEEDGTKKLLSPVFVRELKRPEVVEVIRENAQTKKPQKEKRHIDVVVGTQTVYGESQSSALARYIEAGRQMVVDADERRAS